EKRVFLVILFTSFSGSLVSRISGAVQTNEITAVSEFLNIMGIKGKIIAPIQCDTRKTSLRR
ncbi:hypothetical protein MZE50_21965, partial [Escherichia coli]|nr:hypothetical protein [Escherichia coli]